MRHCGGVAGIAPAVIDGLSSGWSADPGTTQATGPPCTAAKELACRAAGAAVEAVPIVRGVPPIAMVAGSLGAGVGAAFAGTGTAPATIPVLDPLPNVWAPFGETFWAPTIVLDCNFASEAGDAANSAVVSGAVVGFDPIDDCDWVWNVNSVLDFDSIAGCDSCAGSTGCAAGMPTALDATCIRGRAD